MPILDARSLPDDAPATIEGILTTDVGAIEAGRGAFVQDDTAGIALYLDGDLTGATAAAGTVVRVTGRLDTRYGLRTIRSTPAELAFLGSSDMPAPEVAQTGSVGEALEGLRSTVAGEVVDTPSSLSDGLGLMVDDGTGPLRVIVGAAALGAHTVESGDRVLAVGPLGQRDSSGTGEAGYRIHATLPGELVLLPDPSPTPSPSPDRRVAEPRAVHRRPLDGALALPSASPSPAAPSGPPVCPSPPPMSRSGPSSGVRRRDRACRSTQSHCCPSRTVRPGSSSTCPTRTGAHGWAIEVTASSLRHTAS
jgi:hypothetical protein